MRHGKNLKQRGIRDVCISIVLSNRSPEAKDILFDRIFVWWFAKLVVLLLFDWNSSSACNLHSTQAVVYHSCRHWKTVSLFFVYVCLQVAIYTANWCTFKLNFEKISYVISKKVFLIFGEREISCPKIKKIQEGTFHAWKIKKSTLKKFPTYQEMELSSPKLKKLLHFFFF